MGRKGQEKILAEQAMGPLAGELCSVMGCKPLIGVGALPADVSTCKEIECGDMFITKVSDMTSVGVKRTMSCSEGWNGSEWPMGSRPEKACKSRAKSATRIEGCR
jgi:hypothetical protein